MDGRGGGRGEKHRGQPSLFISPQQHVSNFSMSFTDHLRDKQQQQKKPKHPLSAFSNSPPHLGDASFHCVASCRRERKLGAPLHFDVVVCICDCAFGVLSASFDTPNFAPCISNTLSPPSAVCKTPAKRGYLLPLSRFILHQNIHSHRCLSVYQNRVERLIYPSNPIQQLKLKYTDLFHRENFKYLFLFIFDGCGLDFIKTTHFQKT